MANEKKIIEDIEKIIGRPLRRVNMAGYTTTENLYNYNDNENIIMLGLDFSELDMDSGKTASLIESLKRMKNIKRILLKSLETFALDEILKDMNYIPEVVLENCNMKILPEWFQHFKELKYLHLINCGTERIPQWLLNFEKLTTFDISSEYNVILDDLNLEILKILQEKGEKEDRGINGIKGIKGIKVLVNQVFELQLQHNLPKEQIDIIYEIEKKNKFRSHSAYLKHRTGFRDGKLIEWKIVHFPGLKTLPENFGVLNSLESLTITQSDLEALPSSIGDLKNLKMLELSDNPLGSLPTSFIKLNSIETLILKKCNFTEIPAEIWPLKNLIRLELEGNPLSEEEKILLSKPLDFLLNYLREKASIKIFISHAVVEYESYHIKELVEYLEKQKEISEVYFCESDLAGNIDQWMLDTVQKCQLLLFIGTQKSVFNSPDCNNELQLANKFLIPVIPLKGRDIEWTDLAEKNLSRELGLEYDMENYPSFFDTLYQYIKNFKREINLMDKESRNKGLTDIYERFRLILDEKLSAMAKKIETLETHINQIETEMEKNKKEN